MIVITEHLDFYDGMVWEDNEIKIFIRKRLHSIVVVD